MKGKVKSLVLSGFRGATQPVELLFDTSKPVTLIFGENGTGKSTIADAFDFVCNESFGSLADRSMAAQPKSHVASLGQDSKNLKVIVGTTLGNFTGTLTKAGPSIDPSVCGIQARILRKSSILRLLDAQPKQRFETLKTFISVPGIEASENSLREAVRELARVYDEAVRSYRQASDALDELWIAEGTPGSSSLGWGASEAANDVSKLAATISSINAIENAFTESERALVALDLALEEVAKATADQATTEEQQQIVEQKQPARSTALVSLLRSAKDHVARHHASSTCPVCEQGVNTDALLARLSVRIGEMAELVTVSSKVADAKQAKDRKTAIADQARTSLIQKIEKLGLLLKQTSFTEVSALGIDWPSYGDFFAGASESTARESAARMLWAAASPCRQSLSLRKRKEEKSLSLHNAIKGHYETHTKKLAAAEAHEALSGRLSAALEIVLQRRKGYVEEILHSISSEVERLYTALHPGEGIGKVRFYLKPNAIGSLEFDAEFQGESALPPQAYYSESHLDTLGVCVFLALARHFMTDNTVVILDDVVTSADGPHLDRFMKLLHEEAPHLNQVIVTTHFRTWRDRYRNARGPAANTQVIELRMWSIDWGIQSDEAVTAIKELRTCLTAKKMDRQAVASKAGIQLESILDFLTFQYSCKMPRQADPNYTLGALAAGIDGKLGKLLKSVRSDASEPKIETSLKVLIDDATSKNWIRNRAGCHFSNLGSEISDLEVKEFGDKVLALAEALICPKCEIFPQIKPSGSFWQCGCGSVELHPLVQPGAPISSVKEAD
jgi:energy-coupling factor transporter ATP-binding protein EcfA2